MSWTDYSPMFLLLVVLSVVYQYDLLPEFNQKDFVININIDLEMIEKMKGDQISLNCERNVTMGKEGQFPLVFLTSFPGSGNTWTRLLIEDVTGFYSGSVYFDQSLFDGGFIGEIEETLSGKTVVVKNHRIKSLKDAKGIILLIRNPYDAILAEFNRVSSKKDANGSKHTGTTDPAKFNTTLWFDKIDYLSKKWLSVHNLYVDHQKSTNIPILLLSYEDLKLNATNEMTKVLRFLDENFEISVPDAKNRFGCLAKLELINASFKRVKVPFQWEIYPEDKIREIDQFITFVRSRFAEVGLPDLPEYYRNSKNEDHKLIKASRLERISNNMKG